MSLPNRCFQLGSEMLAQSSTGIGSVIGMIARLVAVLIVAAVLVGLLAVVRRGYKEAGTPVARDFSLGDLRALHREGKLTAEEFEKAKARLVEETRNKLLKEVKPTKAETPFQEELKDA